MILLDTNVLIFDALFPEKLSAAAKKKLNSEKHFACADISLLEIARLIFKKRIQIDCEIEPFIEAALNLRGTEVLPITPAIAALSQTLGSAHKDPADLLIAATAMHYNIPLVSSDGVLKKITGLKCFW